MKENHRQAIIDNLNLMDDKLPDDSEYYDALYHLDMLCEEYEDRIKSANRENDLIAEYVKENYKQILGFGFAIWKLGFGFKQIFKKATAEIKEDKDIDDLSRIYKDKR